MKFQRKYYYHLLKRRNFLLFSTVNPEGLFLQEPSNLVPEVKRVGRCALSFDLSGCSRFFVSDIRGFLRVTGVSFQVSFFRDRVSEGDWCLLSHFKFLFSERRF